MKKASDDCRSELLNLMVESKKYDNHAHKCGNQSIQIIVSTCWILSLDGERFYLYKTGQQFHPSMYFTQAVNVSSNMYKVRTTVWLLLIFGL